MHLPKIGHTLRVVNMRMCASTGSVAPAMMVGMLLEGFPHGVVRVILSSINTS